MFIVSLHKRWLHKNEVKKFESLEGNKNESYFNKGKLNNINKFIEELEIFSKNLHCLKSD